MNRVSYLILDIGKKDNNQSTNITQGCKNGSISNQAAGNVETRRTSSSINGNTGDATSDCETAKPPSCTEWHLELEDFISSIQSEPDLCQFFAEQYVIDLKGRNIDPLVNTYTASFITSIN